MIPAVLNTPNKRRVHTQKEEEICRELEIRNRAHSFSKTRHLRISCATSILCTDDDCQEAEENKEKRGSGCVW